MELLTSTTGVDIAALLQNLKGRVGGSTSSAAEATAPTVQPSDNGKIAITD
ncbi:MAG TPA: hypothetical protein VIR33_05910 [Thermopolyspora sp.]